MKDVYPPKTVERVLEKYGELMASVLEAAAKYKVKVLLGSKGVVTDLTRLLGCKARFEALRKRHGQLFVNIHSDHRKLRTMFHPECVTNPRCLTSIYKFICEQLNLAMTALLVYLTGDKTAKCTFRNKLCKHISGTDTFLFSVQARRDLYARTKKRMRESWEDGMNPLREYHYQSGGISKHMHESWEDGTNPLPSISQSVWRDKQEHAQDLRGQDEPSASVLRSVWRDKRAHARELGGWDEPSANLPGGTQGRTPRANQQAHARELGGRDEPSSVGEFIEEVG